MKKSSELYQGIQYILTFHYCCRGRIRTFMEQLVPVKNQNLSSYSPPPRQEGMAADFITLQ